MKHILFEKALIYKKRKDITPSDEFKYDHVLGAWINRADHSLLIESSDFKAKTTKKMDVETGEDQKGQ
jgi:hypothetical protein